MIKKNTKAFTLIELLIVVSIIGVLAGVLLRVINVNRVQGTAQDGVRQANIGKLVTGIEAFYVSEGRYPTVGDVSSGDEINNTTNPHEMSDVMRVYLSTWPEGVNDTGTVDSAYTYQYEYVDANTFYLHTLGSQENCFKYHSGWQETRSCDAPLNVCPSGDSC